MKARPTTYKGTLMRSRLEAQFAAECDQLGATWEYEPACFADETGQYLPDFLVNYGGMRGRVYVEVKPRNADFHAALRRMHIIRASEPTAELVVVTQENDFAGSHFIHVTKCGELAPCRECRSEQPHTVTKIGRAVLGARANGSSQ